MGMLLTDLTFHIHTSGMHRVPRGILVSLIQVVCGTLGVSRIVQWPV